MSQLGVVAIVALCAWLGVLTLVQVLVVRQISLLTLRLAHPERAIPVAEDGFSVDDDGPEIGSLVPEEAASLLPGLDRRTSLLLLVSGTCKGCHELAEELNRRPDAVTRLPTTALVPGPPDLADAVVELLPSSVSVVSDPEATQLANAFEIHSTPFAVTVQEGRVLGKTYVHDKADLVSLVGEAEGQALDQIPRG